MASVERFLTGKPETVRKLNALVDAVKSLQNLNGDVFIRTANTPAGTTVRLNFAAVLERIMKNSGGGNKVQQAFVKTVPTSGISLIVFLGEDTNGEEVTVTCHIMDGDGTAAFFVTGDGDGGVIPKMIDGQRLYVQKDISGTWRNVTPIYRYGSCP